MTLDEAIKHEEELANRESENAEWFDLGDDSSEMFREKCEKCRECAKEHRQLAEWLKELKQLREQTRWIPMTEGLPKPWGSVLITFSGKYGALTADHAVGIGSWDGINGWYFEEIEGYTDRLTVSAWMNLPESYKEG